MCDPVTLTIAATTVMAAGSAYGGLAANAQGKYEQRVAEQNAGLERRKFADATERGAIDQMRRYRESAAAIGRQRANAGAMGLDADFGSLMAGQDDTAMIAQEDVYTIGKNTGREIEGYDINVSNFVSGGRAARSRGKAEMFQGFAKATSTLLSGGSQVGQLKKQGY